MEIRCGGLLFTSKFDSGNLAQVEKARRSDSDSDDGNGGIPMYGCSVTPDYEFNVWTKPDCAGTPYENGNRSWFYFGIKGYAPNRLIKLNVVNLNRQGKLYSQGMSPLVKVVPSKPKWERIRDRPTHQMVEGQFVLSFTYRFSENRGGTTYFAFCYPWSYTECQESLQILDKKFEGCHNLKPNEASEDAIYYHRELLCHTMDQRRVDLITITSCENMTWFREPRLENLFPDKATPRAHRFEEKQVYFLSSRVHPGETPASFVFNGFVKFILRENDPRAKMLRKRYIFKLIPMLNPDGVYRGHYRTDQKGVNLNRVYLNPDPDLHSPIFASRSLILFYHHYYKTKQLEPVQPHDSHAEGNGTLQEKHVVGEDTVVTESHDDIIEDFKRVNLQVEGIKKYVNVVEAAKNRHSHMLSDTKYTPFQGDYLSISPSQSGVAYYVDLHGHASKRGCFIYGNHLEAEDDQVKNLLYPKLISLNSAHFDFNGCNFTERNMYLKDKRDGMSKEGSGRVAMFKVAGLIHSYTLECNYNTGRTVNCVPQATHDNGRATPVPLAGFPPKYTPDIFEEVGRALAVAVLDMIQQNPWSRILHSEFTTFDNLKHWMIRYVRSSRGNPILPRKMGRISTRPPPSYSNSSNSLNSNNNSSIGAANTTSTAATRSSRFSTTDLTKSSSNARASNVAARNIYTNSQLPNTSNRLAPVKTSSVSSTNGIARKPVNSTNSRFQSDSMKRQKSLIRTAVNGASSSAPVNSNTQTPVGLSVSPMHGIHLQGLSGIEANSKNVHLTLSYALGSGKMNEVLASRSFLTSTSQSNPETSAAGDTVRYGADYNSDSELIRGSPPSLRLKKGVPIHNSDDFEQVGNSPLAENLFSAGVAVKNAAPDDRVRSVKALYLGQSSNRKGNWNSISKPPPSRLPVRSITKGFITPQVTKPPSILHRGRNTANMGNCSPNFTISPSRANFVTQTSPSHVAIGPGGAVAVPVNTNKLHNSTRFPDTSDPSAYAHATNASFVSGSAALSFQPLSVSQKPLLLPGQKDERSTDSPLMYNYSKHERVVSANDGILTSSPNRQDRDELAFPTRSSARRSGKGKFGKRKPFGKLAQSTSVDQRSKTPLGKETPGKKKFKSRPTRRVQSLKQNEETQEELFAEAIRLTPRPTDSPMPETGDIVTLEHHPKAFLNEDLQSIFGLDEPYLNMEKDGKDFNAEPTSYKVVLDSEYLFEAACDLESAKKTN